MDYRKKLEQLMQRSIAESAAEHLAQRDRQTTPDKMREAVAEMKAMEKSMEDSIAAVEREYNIVALSQKKANSLARLGYLKALETQSETPKKLTLQQKSQIQWYNGLTEERRKLVDSAEPLTPKEEAMLQRGLDTRSRVHKAKEAEMKMFTEEVMQNPYNKMSDLALNFYNAATENPKADRMDLFMKLKWPESQKLDLLYHVRDYCKNNGIATADLQMEADQHHAVPQEKLDAIRDYNVRIGISVMRTKKNGTVVEDKSPYFETHKGLMGFMVALFGTVDDPGYSQGQRNKRNYEKIQAFCDKTLQKIHMQKLCSASAVEGDSYFTKDNASFMRSARELNALRHSMEMDHAMENTALSFGRKGSKPFQEMQKTFTEFKKSLEAYTSKPTPEAFEKLTQQYKDLSTRSEAYLQYKEKQMLKNEIDHKDYNVGGRIVMEPTNSVTRKRMDFAKTITQKLEAMRGYMEKEHAAMKEMAPAGKAM